MFDTQIIQLDPNKQSGSIVVNIPFTASYYAVMNPTGADLHIANGLPGAQPPDAILISNGDTVSLTTQATNTQTVFWSGTVTSSNITVTLQYSDQPIPASVANRTVNVVGSVGLTGTPNVNIGNTPAVTIASGNVNTNTLVINESSQSVPVQQQSYYGDSSEGAFSPTYVIKDSTTDFSMVSISTINGEYYIESFFVYNGSETDSVIWFADNQYFYAYLNTGASAIGIWSGSQSTSYDNVSVPAGTVTQGSTYVISLHVKPNGYAQAQLLDANFNILLNGNWVNLTSHFNFNQNSTARCTFNGNTGTRFRVIQTGYWFRNTANQADIHNFSSVNIPSGITVNWLNNAEYTTWFVNGDCTINGTIQAANALPNASTSAQVTLFNGNIVVSKGGNGGNGGQGGSNSNGSPSPQPGGAGGAASAYGSGSGGGGGGGNFGNMSGATPGSAGTNGYGTATGGTGGPGYGGSGAGGNGQNATGGSTATLITIANGNINVIGTINSSGGNGGNGGGQGSPNGSQQGGCGAGGAGAGVNGNGGQGQAAFSNTSWAPSAGGGGGGSGGGSVVLYAAKAVNVTGTINVNGGLAGSPGQDNTLYDAKAGQNGQAGTIKIYQYNNAIAG